MNTFSHFRARVVLLVAAALALMGAAPISAQTYPSRPVQLVVAYPSGGTGDLVTKAIVDKLAAALGQPINIDYRPGASGAVGTQSVVRAAPDGYTLLVGQTVEIAVNHALVKDLGYDPAKDLQPVALLAVIPVALVVPSSAPYASVGDLLKGSRSSSRGLLFASGGVGTTGHLAGELLRLRTSSRFVHAPFEGAAAASNALLEGRVDFYFEPFPLAIPQVKAGKLKMLAQASTKRALAAPSAPTVAEQTGIRNFDITAWVGIFAPRSTPPEIVTKLNQAINEVLAQPEVRERLISAGAEIAPMSVGQFRDFVGSEIRKNTDLLSEDFCSKVLYGGCEGFGTLQ